MPLKKTTQQKMLIYEEHTQASGRRSYSLNAGCEPYQS
jgi:hypothetical protein